MKKFKSISVLAVVLSVIIALSAVIAYADFLGDANVNGNKVNITVTGKADDDELQVVTQKGESKELEQIFDSVTF